MYLAISVIRCHSVSGQSDILDFIRNFIENWGRPTVLYSVEYKIPTSPGTHLHRRRSEEILWALLFHILY